jgi:hypothetical protein
MIEHRNERLADGLCAYRSTNESKAARQSEPLPSCRSPSRKPIHINRLAKLRQPLRAIWINELFAAKPSPVEAD